MNKFLFRLSAFLVAAWIIGILLAATAFKMGVL